MKKIVSVSKKASGLVYTCVFLPKNEQVGVTREELKLKDPEMLVKFDGCSLKVTQNKADVCSIKTHRASEMWRCWEFTN